jgi:two-component system chemotaxis response regulator CheY
VTEQEKPSAEMCFLVVDDDANVRTLVVELLKSFGYSKILAATDAYDALSQMGSAQVDFIISDWQMPGMSGLDFLKTLRAQAATRNIPFIMITNPDSEEVRKVESAVEARVDAYVIKPFRADVLDSKISEVLSKRGDVAGNGILVVDDDPGVRAIIVENVKELGHSPIFEASNGNEALELMKKHAGEIALVISDWEMPEVTGIRLLKKIRADKDIEKTPFIMVTSQSSVENLKLMEALNAHVSHYLMKPFTGEALRSKIGFVLSRTESDRKIQMKLSDAKKACEDDRPTDAQDLYNEILSFDPKNIPAQLGLAEIRLHDPKRERSIDEAISLIKKAMKLNPKDDAPYIALAKAFEHAKSLDKAIQILKSALTKVPMSEAVHYHLGRLHIRRGHTELGAASLKKALEINPDFEDALDLLQGKKKP